MAFKARTLPSLTSPQFVSICRVIDTWPNGWALCLAADRHARFRPSPNIDQPTKVPSRRCLDLTCTVRRGYLCIRQLCSRPNRQEGSGFIQPPGGGDDVLNARRWTRILGNYSTPNRLRSIAELAITALPLIVLWTAAWFTFSPRPCLGFIADRDSGCRLSRAPVHDPARLRSRHLFCQPCGE